MSVLLLMLLAWMCTGSSPLPGQQLAATNNVLVILADDLGVDSVGVYGEGASPPPTPNVDALAARGVLFRNCWSNAVCSPTRAAIQTGRYSLRTRVGHIIGPLVSPLSHRELTLPRVLDLGGTGYRHAAIGKWHLGHITDPYHPNEAGWSHFAGLIAGSVPDYFAWPRTVNGSTSLSRVYATTQMVDDALAWIQNQNGPWVCYLAFAAVHFPMHAPPAHLHGQNLAGKDPATEPIPFHAAMVEAMDTEIGRLLAALGPQLQNTDVILLGDNGTDKAVSQPPFLPAHAKSTPYEGGINVPLIVAGPSVRSPGREVRALVGAVDVFSTVTELAGVDAAAVVPGLVELDAVSFAPYLSNPEHAPLRTTVFAEQFFGSSWSSAFQNGFATVRDARHKLIRFYGSQPPREELYDLESDPFETTDLLAGVPNEAARMALFTLRSEIDSLRSPRGGLQAYGTLGCAGSNGYPAIGGRGTPAVGGSYEVTLTGAAPARPATLLLGLSDTRWGALRLPFDLVLLGAGPGCVLWCSGEGQLPVQTSGSGEASVTITLPSNPDFVGLLLFHTWLVGDPGAPFNALGAVVSDGAMALIGT